MVSLAAAGALLVLVAAAHAATTVPNEIKQPGTQPGEVSTFQSPNNCDNCHDDSGGSQDRQLYPGYGWRGGMMANASRDPIFWATLAIAEQDFLPGSDPNARGGAGDLCLRCHTVNGWIAGRSVPTSGVGLSSSADTDGVECEFCHLLVNPDPPVNVPGTVEMYNPPFEPFDPPPSSEPYYGSGQYVLNAEGTRLGPYADTSARHQFKQSFFHRQSELCGTCHDVSNPAVGDLAHNNGAQIPLPAGKFSGILGSPVDGKAAFNNPPYKYGIVERTFSEWKASGYDTLLVNNYPSLPADLRKTGGALEIAYTRAWTARSNANYEDGTARYYTCQTCHMSASTGVGCNKSGTPTRTDLPRHDQTGSGYWMPDAVIWQNDKGRLRFGGGLTTTQRNALAAGKTRARDVLRSSASLGATQSIDRLKVRVTNLTGHKLITGYPEGRRMWLNVKFRNGAGTLLGEEGAYGPIGRSVADRDGTVHQVQSLLDLSNTVVYEAKPGMDQEWANQLLGLGYSPSLAISYNRITDAVDQTLGQLAATPIGTARPTFHFVLNNVLLKDIRIPPWGFTYDEARTRNALPVPASRFGAPGPGGTYNYWDDVSFVIPQGTVTAEVRLFYQQTSWEYIQFLWLGNDRLNTFLADEGINMRDAWLNTGQSPPLELTAATAPVQAFSGPVTGLVFTDRTTLSWSPAASATVYDVMRGSLSSLRANRSVGDATCFRNDLATTSTTDTALPAAGNGFYYLVRGDGTALLAGSYDNPAGVAAPSEGRDAEIGTAGGSGCGDLP